MSGGASGKPDRATRASHGAAARLHHSAGIPSAQRGAGASEEITFNPAENSQKEVTGIEEGNHPRTKHRGIPSATTIMTELGALWMDYVGRDHHKDRDCHFSIDQSFSYGEPPVWTAAHFGYVDDGFGHACAAGSKERRFATYDTALAFMIDETLAMFRRHFRALTPETIEALKRLSAQGIEARQRQNAERLDPKGESPVGAADAP